MADIKQAIEYSKQNPNSAFATELRKRIESGELNSDLKSAGLSQFVTQTKPSLMSQIINDPIKTLVVKPAARLGQAVAGLGVNLFGSEQTKANFDKASQQDTEVPSFTGNMTVEGQKGGAEGAKQIVGDAAKSASYLAGGEGAAATAESAIKSTIGSTILKGAGTGAVGGGLYGFGDSIQKEGSTLGSILEDTFKSSVFGAVAGGATAGLIAGAGKAVNAAVDGINSVGSKVKNANIVSKITDPAVSEATKVSLNPVKALEGKNSDFKVSVGGKLKNVADITPTENAKLKVSTEKSIDSFTKNAEKFKLDRNPLNDPTEIVGKRVDTALGFADKKRQAVGKRMGDIEQAFSNEATPVKDSTLKSFVDVVDYVNNPTYGVSSRNAPQVQKFIQDFDQLNTNGLTVEERNKFVRSWQSYLKDAKDGFGNFKENATVNTKLETALNNLKNETVDFVSSKSADYRKLRATYRQYKLLEETADRLLGKDGLLGDKIKGGATIKRALKSNSDAGARQFLIKLKEITGYDAIRDGDLALTSMENVGDFQGLSLLEVLKSGKSGVIGKALEKAQDILTGSKAQRVKNYIKK